MLTLISRSTAWLKICPIGIKCQSNFQLVWNIYIATHAFPSCNNSKNYYCLLRCCKILRHDLRMVHVSVHVDKVYFVPVFVTRASCTYTVFPKNRRLGVFSFHFSASEPAFLGCWCVHTHLWLTSALLSPDPTRLQLRDCISAATLFLCRCW